MRACHSPNLWTERSRARICGLRVLTSPALLSLGVSPRDTQSRSLSQPCALFQLSQPFSQPPYLYPPSRGMVFSVGMNRGERTTGAGIRSVVFEKNPEGGAGVCSCLLPPNATRPPLCGAQQLTLFSRPSYALFQLLGCKFRFSLCPRTLVLPVTLLFSVPCYSNSAPLLVPLLCGGKGEGGIQKYALREQEMDVGMAENRQRGEEQPRYQGGLVPALKAKRLKRVSQTVGGPRLCCCCKSESERFLSARSDTVRTRSKKDSRFDVSVVVVQLRC